MKVPLVAAGPRPSQPGLATEPVHVLIVEPNPERRRELVSSMRGTADLRVIGEGSHLVEACRRNSNALEAHVLVVEIAGPETTSIEWWALIHALLPGVAVVALARDLDPYALVAALGAGVTGLQPFNTRPSILCDAVRRAAQGVTDYDQHLAEQLRRSLLTIGTQGLRLGTVGFPSNSWVVSPGYGVAGRLTFREREVLGLLGQGLRNRDIGTRLHLSERTVRNCVSGILAKLELRSRTEAALWLSAGVASLGER